MCGRQKKKEKKRRKKRKPRHAAPTSRRGWVGPATRHGPAAAGTQLSMWVRIVAPGETMASEAPAVGWGRLDVLPRNEKNTSFNSRSVDALAGEVLGVGLERPISSVGHRTQRRLSLSGGNRMPRRSRLIPSSDPGHPELPARAVNFTSASHPLTQTKFPQLSP